MWWYYPESPPMTLCTTKCSQPFNMSALLRISLHDPHILVHAWHDPINLRPAWDINLTTCVLIFVSRFISIHNTPYQLQHGGSWTWNQQHSSGTVSLTFFWSEETGSAGLPVLLPNTTPHPEDIQKRTGLDSAWRKKKDWVSAKTSRRFGGENYPSRSQTGYSSRFIQKRRKPLCLIQKTEQPSRIIHSSPQLSRSHPECVGVIQDTPDHWNRESGMKSENKKQTWEIES